MSETLTHTLNDAAVSLWLWFKACCSQRRVSGPANRNQSDVPPTDPQEERRPTKGL